MKKILHILMAAILLESVHALALSEIQVAYQAQVLKIDEERKASVDTLQKSYLKALDGIRNSFQKAGDLDRILKVKEESELIKKGTWPLPPLPEELEHRVAASRKLYLKTYVKFDRAWAMSMIKVSEKMITLLNKKRVELTKAGDLEEAKKAQMLTEVINKDPDVMRARELPKRVSEGGHARGAFVLRRGGDNIEVLVKYDSSGKLSLKSPVENVVEQTESRKERGETAAKTLGEFVGAKGFEVDAYTSFDKSVESGKFEFTQLIGSSVEKTTEIKDGPAMVIKLGKKVSNAYFRIAGVLSPLHAPATHRITVQYFVPKDNHKVVGLNFQHGGASGKPIGKPITTVGKWETATLEAASGSSDDFLTGYFRGPSFKEFPASGGDRVYLKALKIEHIKFSAFIVEELGSSGNPAKKETDSGIQRMFVKNGVILAN